MRKVFWVVLGMAFAAAAVGLWAGASWFELARRRVDLENSRARVEAAARARLALVDNLLGSAERSDPGWPLRELRSVRRSLDELTSLLDDPRRTRAWIATDRRLATALRSVGESAPAEAFGDLREPLERAHEALLSELARLESARGAYESASRRFPASLLVGPVGRTGGEGRGPR